MIRVMSLLLIAELSAVNASSTAIFTVLRVLLMDEDRDVRASLRPTAAHCQSRTDYFTKGGLSAIQITGACAAVAMSRKKEDR
jgi:hypothetical protein